MSLNIYYSINSDFAVSELLKTINPNNLKEENIIITPDRRGLLTEQQLFSATKTKSFFNVNVTTFTRFTNDLIKKNSLNNKKVLTKSMAVALIKKILLEEKDNLVSFKKSVSFNGTAEKIFETLIMFKSCNVSVSDIMTDTKNNALNNKLKDIKLVYEKYEAYLQNEYTDSFNKINLLSEIIDTQKFSDTNFYFVGFDDFTPQIYEIIKKLIRKSKSLNITAAASYDFDLNNKNIFLNNIYLNVLDSAKLIGVKPNIVKCDVNLSVQKHILSKNLFAYNTDKCDIKLADNKIQITGFNNISDEVEYLTKYILYHTINSKKNFSDFNIIVPSISMYKKEIKNFFKSEGIRYYIDENKKFIDNILVRIYLSLFDMINSNFKETTVFQFLKNLNYLSDYEIAVYENFILKTGHTGQMVLKPLTSYKEDISGECKNIYKTLLVVNEFYEKVKTVDTVSGFIDKLIHFNDSININLVIENIKNQYESDNNFVESKLLMQVNEKMQSSYLELSSLLGDYQTSFTDFTSIFESYLNNITLSLPPIEVDTVFIADSVNSFIEEKSIMFILGANEGVLPVSLDDLGIISDNDIKLLSQKNKLSPTVNYINKRNKFLLYEKILKYKDSLQISYITVNDKNEELVPASLVTNIKDMFNITDGQDYLSPFNISGQLLLQKTSFYEDVFLPANFDKYIFNNISKNFARQNFINNIKDWFFYSNNANYLTSLSTLYKVLLSENELTGQEYLNNANYKNLYEKIDNAYELFFANKTTSVSQFETYFNCPFRHFINYGLKLKESDTSEVDFRDFGTIIHDFVAFIMPTIILAKNNSLFTDEMLRLESEKVFDKIIMSEDYERVYQNPKNKFIINSLKDECFRISKALLYEQNNSDFTPIGFEERFDGKDNSSLKISSDEKYVYINGVVDRYDILDNKFRVIDYKTGQSDFNDYDELASGAKVQLFVYVMALQDKLKKECVGTFYMPLKNMYSKEEDVDGFYKLQGVFEDNLSTILSYDKNLVNPETKSNIIKATTLKNGSLSTRNKNIMLEKEDILWLSKFALKLLEVGFKNIVAGNIEPNPLDLKGQKNYYDINLLGMNNFNEIYDNKFRVINKIKDFNKDNLIFELNVLNNNDDMIFNAEFAMVNASEVN